VKAGPSNRKAPSMTDPSNRTPTPNGTKGAPGGSPFTEPTPGGKGKTVATLFGEIVWLFSQSPKHKNFFVSDLEWLVMTPVLLKQFRLFYAPDRPIGVALWGEAVAGRHRRALRRTRRDDQGFEGARVQGPGGALPGGGGWQGGGEEGVSKTHQEHPCGYRRSRWACANGGRSLWAAASVLRPMEGCCVKKASRAVRTQRDTLQRGPDQICRLAFETAGGT
jgi:hypothetical protein